MMAACCWPPLVATADAASSAHAVAERATQPSPPVTAGRTHAGLRVHGTKKKKSRLQTGPSAPDRRSPRKHKRATTHADRPRQDPAQILKQDVRLNVGMCGRAQPDGSVPGP